MQCRRPWKKRLKGRSGVGFDNSKGGMRLALRCTHAEGSFPSRGEILRRCSSLPSFPWACDCNLNYQEAFLPLRKESIGSGVPGGKRRCGERKGKSAVKLNQNCLGGDRVCARQGVLHFTEKKVSSQNGRLFNIRQSSQVQECPPEIQIRSHSFFKEQYVQQSFT